MKNLYCGIVLKNVFGANSKLHVHLTSYTGHHTEISLHSCDIFYSYQY